jgi:16S rRNA (uracil1498-N3)-methyltransferase
MSERFFSAQQITGDRITLDGAEAHHLLHVMRGRVGDRVTLFDDSGVEFDSEIESLGRSTAEVRVLERREVNRELAFALSVGVALPKGDRQKWLVEKLTELGVAELVPLTTERGVAQPTASALERLRRSVIEATKQCGRNRLMRIAEPLSWDDWIRREAPRRLLAHPGGLASSQIDGERALDTQICVGPEGGLTDSEIKAAVAAGWKSVDLGPRILRVETAAVALAAAVALR